MTIQELKAQDIAIVNGGSAWGSFKHFVWDSCISYGIPIVTWLGIHAVVTGTQMEGPLAPVAVSEDDGQAPGRRNMVRFGILSACGKGLITGLFKKFILDNIPPE